MRKTKRLLKLLELVPQDSKIVFDVGCDHGILSALIILSGKAEKVYASDISKMSLAKTEVLAKGLHLEDKIECIHSDGLDNYDKNLTCDCVIIAGMGGNEIIKILSNIQNIENCKSFLLQPAQDFWVLREYLSGAGFKIEKDEIIEDKGKFYSNIFCVRSNEKDELSDIQCYFGKCCEEDISVDFISFVNYTYTKLLERKDYLSDEDLKRLTFCKKRT